jgi:RNA polymerase sigma-54 factor
MPKNLLQQKLGFNINLTPLLKSSIELLTIPYDDLLVEINNALEKNILLIENTEKTGVYSSNYEKTNEDAFAKLEYKESMFSNLENQLPNIGLTAEQLNIAYIMVENLTEVGFLEVNIETIMRIYLRKQPGSKISTQQCEEVRGQMQINLEPFGTVKHAHNIYKTIRPFLIK